MPTGTLDTTAEPRHRAIRLLDVHPDLGADLGPAELEQARQAVVSPLITIARGEQVNVHQLGDLRPFGFVVVDGLLMREVQLAGRAAASVYGPRDVFGPRELDDPLPASGTTFTALTPARLAVLDDRFLLSARRWPRLVSRLVQALSEQLGRACVRQAVSQLPRAEQRVVALFWLLAESWGRMRPDGVVIDLPLTHEALGKLVGARRPTMSLALGLLAEENYLRRYNGGGWLLSRDSLELLDGPWPAGLELSGRYGDSSSSGPTTSLESSTNTSQSMSGSC